MTGEIAASTDKAPYRSPPGNSVVRAFALIEVVSAFAIVHVAYRSFKHFTELGRAEGAAGLNFSPGLAMTLFTVAFLLLSRKRFDEYGLTTKGWRSAVPIGVFWEILFLSAAILVLRLAPIPFDPLHPPDMARSLVATAGELLNAVLLLWFLMRERRVLRLVPPLVALLVLDGLLCVPLVVAWSFNRPLRPVLLSVVWNFFCAGFGEEIFFRGYIQSRVNEAFGRPFRFLGVDFGLGVFVSAGLFGFIHVLNTVDYFGGRYDFAWWWWPPNFAAGLFFGLLREKTRSILAGGIMHGLADVAAIVPVLLA
jgi:CAAX protease family protein